MQRNVIPGQVGGVESIRKVLRILLAFGDVRPLMNAADLAAELDLPRSSVYRYLALLREMGMLEEVDNGMHRVTHRLLPIARAAQTASSDVVSLVRPVLQRITADTSETSLLLRRFGYNVVCVDCVPCVRPIRLSLEVGRGMTLHAGSAGKLLLAAMTARERAAYREHLAAGAGRPTVPVPDDETLDELAARGWTESFEEVDEGVWGTAAVLDDGSGIIGALGLAGPLSRLTPERRAASIEMVRARAAELNATLQQVRQLT